MKKRSVEVPLEFVLEPLFQKYNQAVFLSSDPLEFPHRYSDAWDQECVGLLSAVMAYGKVGQIRRSVEDLLARMARAGPRPSEVIRLLATAEGRRRWSKELEGFVHRFNVGDDFFVFSRLLERSWRVYGSFGAHLSSYVTPACENFGAGLSKVFQDWERWRAEWGSDEAGLPSFSYLVTPPSSGSACKRWCMALRWMVRKDALDLGLWRKGSVLLPGNSPGLSPNQLVMPLDTHTGRISQYLGLTERKTLGWRAACEITDRLRECDPKDPVRYDFALARLGILDLCQRRFRVEICQGCDLVRVCRFARKGLSSQALRYTPS